ncbi:hypothetical protein [Bradyrhizobium sp. BR13661]|jgi:hypothetical protein|uniref:hypothetical protein n=1 Tax=Bradyrhizobium sp. BR13661 TaxID=2940622 RepID=UPI00247471C6|nr:hypothetical protein [Bradyrhizobium sp. BR13661]MDH6258422.1 hypothetical protein [Bradyrhizobium sp. BR13661]
MTSKLKPDEEFVARSLATHFDGIWSPGENPPDIYLEIGSGAVAVEISILTQHVVDERGGTKPRLSEDSTALWLANELEKELSAIILAGRVFVLTLRAPISNARRTKEALRTRLLSLAAGNGDETIDVEETILGNRIGVHLTSYDGSDRRKVLAVVANRKSDPHIGSNARSILEERIVTKSDKCSSFAAKTPVWLALLNDYFLADDETYRQALAQISASHIFEKIILISGNGSVATLYDGTA